MKSSSAFSQVSITKMGASAHACLAPDKRGKVLATFSNAIYLLTDDSELFWIVSGDALMHRRALNTSSPFDTATPVRTAPLSGPQAGSLFYVQDHHLTIDPGYLFNFDAASIWQEPQISENIIKINEIPARVHSLFSSLDLSQPKGFGNFIPDILHLSQNESTDPQPQASDPILVHARPLVLNIARAYLENQPSKISQNTFALIGLGGGLTPSGDDFMGGLSFALKILQTTYPNGFEDYAISVEPYRTRTHQISFTLLQDHAGGYAIEPLHHIINGILSGESFESIYPFILQLTQIGHSTGWDLLAGLLTGLLVTYPSLRGGLVVE